MIDKIVKAHNKCEKLDQDGCQVLEQITELDNRITGNEKEVTKCIKMTR